MISLIFSVIIIMIITSTIIYNGVTSKKVKAINELYSDLESLNDRVLVYYSKNDELPILNKYTSIKNDISAETLNINDGQDYYEIDISKLENIRLQYGDKSRDKKDVYVINKETHTIYYPLGVELEGKIYSRFPGNYTKLEN